MSDITLVFPARAGMSRLSATVPPDATSVPRASGDEPVRGHKRQAVEACSPRERG